MDDNLLRLLMMAGPGGPPPGSTWTPRTQSTLNWRCICWSPEQNKFVAFSSSSGGASSYSTSTNGITWTSTTWPTSAIFNRVIWVAELGLYVAVASGVSGPGRPSVVTSPDGVTWTTRIPPGNQSNWTDIAWSPSLNLLVATRAVTSAGVSLDKIATSPDGVNWTLRNVPADPTGNDPVLQTIAYSPTLGLFIAGGGGSSLSNRLLSSPDGITWTPRATVSTVPTAFRSTTDVIWSFSYNKFVTTGINQTTLQTAVGYSPDGINWSFPAGETISSTGGSWFLVEAGTTLLSLHNTGGTAAQSSRVTFDGINWAYVSAPVSQWNDMAYSPKLKRVVGVSLSTPYVVTSP